MNLNDLRTGLADTIRAALDRSGRQTAVYPYDPFQESPTFPRVVITPAFDYINYRVALTTGCVDVYLNVVVEVSTGDGISTGMALDAYVLRNDGEVSASIVDAIEADPTLDGLVTDCNVEAVTYNEGADSLLATLRVLVRVDQ